MYQSLLSVQVDKIVGKGAPEDFVQKLEGVANSHHDQLVVDVIRAYFFGARYIVEVGFILARRRPADSE